VLNACEEAMPLTANSSPKIKPTISYVFPPEAFKKTLKVFTERLEKAVKVTVTP